MLGSYSLCMRNNSAEYWKKIFFVVKSALIYIFFFHYYFQWILEGVSKLGKQGGKLSRGQCFDVTPLMSRFVHTVFTHIVLQQLPIWVEQNLQNCYQVIQFLRHKKRFSEYPAVIPGFPNRCDAQTPLHVSKLGY